MFLSYSISVTYYFYNKFPLEEKVFCHSHYILWVVYRCISKEKSYSQKFGKQDFGKKMVNIECFAFIISTRYPMNVDTCSA